MSNVVSRSSILVVYATTPNAEATRASEQIVRSGTPNAELTRTSTHVVAAGTPHAIVTRVTQFVITSNRQLGILDSNSANWKDSVSLSASPDRESISDSITNFWKDGVSFAFTLLLSVSDKNEIFSEGLAFVEQPRGPVLVGDRLVMKDSVVLNLAVGVHVADERVLALRQGTPNALVADERLLALQQGSPNILATDERLLALQQPTPNVLVSDARLMILIPTNTPAATLVLQCIII